MECTRLVSLLEEPGPRGTLVWKWNEIYPLQKGVLKDIISPEECNGPVEVGVCLEGIKWRQSIV